MCSPVPPAGSAGYPVPPTPLVAPAPLVVTRPVHGDDAVIDVLVEGYIRMDDHDGDGALTIGGPETERDMGDRHSSITVMAHVADRLGDGDGRATGAEFRQLLTTFDRGDATGRGAGDGRLDRMERAAWLATGAVPTVRMVLQAP